MNGTDALIALAQAFEDAGLPYMIVGSYSSNFYGIPRSTKDADLVVNLDQADWKKLSSILPPELELRWSRGAKRPKDFTDVVAVMQVQGPARLDWSYIEDWCEKHATRDLLAEAKAEAAFAWEDE